MPDSGVVRPSCGCDPLLTAAGAVSRRIREAYCRVLEGGVVWLAPDRPGLGPHLYDGTTGLAVFLAAYDHVVGGDAHRETVLGTLAPLRRKLRGLAADPARAVRLALPVGGMMGVGSWIYGLVRVGGWLRDPSLVEDAHEATVLFTPERIAADRRLDVVTGSAGAILALLALDGVRPGPNPAGDTPLELAAAFAAHLVEQRVAAAGGHRAWPDPEGRVLGGFAHGASGNAFALLRLFGRTGDPALRDAALEGISSERALFDARADSWWDPRTDRPLQDVAWCHGAPGIALARLGALDVQDDPEVREELGMLVRKTRGVADRDSDDLCCGNSGRAEILLRAGRSLHDGFLLDDARALAMRVIGRGIRGSGPTLFHGLAGIGYMLLTVSSPDRLPCILSLE